MNSAVLVKSGGDFYLINVAATICVPKTMKERLLSLRVFMKQNNLFNPCYPSVPFLYLLET